MAAIHKIQSKKSSSKLKIFGPTPKHINVIVNILKKNCVNLYAFIQSKYFFTDIIIQTSTLMLIVWNIRYHFFQTKIYRPMCLILLKTHFDYNIPSFNL